eukprot:70044_4
MKGDKTPRGWLVIPRSGCIELKPGGGASDGDLPMHNAAANSSSPEVVRVLLEAGGVEQLAAKDSNGRLPMHLAASNSSSEAIKVLLTTMTKLPAAVQGKDWPKVEALLTAAPDTLSLVSAALPQALLEQIKLRVRSLSLSGKPYHTLPPELEQL